MVRALGEVLDTTRDGVLVIDDGSPDGTGEIADRLAGELPWVSVLHREHEGRNRTCVHRGVPSSPRRRHRARPRDGLRLLPRPERRASADRGRSDADLVLGSRYVKGGGTENWGLLRRFVSRGGCIYAQVLLGVRVRDLTGGFKCFRRTALEAIDLDALSHTDTRSRSRRLPGPPSGLASAGDPDPLHERRAGASKMTGAIVAEAIWKVPLLRLRALAGRL